MLWGGLVRLLGFADARPRLSFRLPSRTPS